MQGSAFRCRRLGWVSRRDASASLRSITPATEDQHPHWIRELLTGTAEALPYRVARTLLLLYGQPLVKIASLQTTDNFVVAHELRLVLGADPVPVPAPFAALLEEHCTHRPNLRTTAGTTSTWLFPGYRHGSHLHPHTLMDRIRNLGVGLLGACNAHTTSPGHRGCPTACCRDARLQPPSRAQARRARRRPVRPLCHRLRRPNPNNPRKVVGDVGAR